MDEYFGIIEQLISLFNEAYNDYLYKKASQPEVDIDNYTDVTDYDDEINNILTMLNYLQTLKAAPVFARLTRERWLEYLESLEYGTDYYMNMTETYTVKDYEDIQTIADNYGVDWQEILRLNSLKSTDIEGGVVIRIPIRKQYNTSEINVDVFGGQDGEGSMGADLENYLDVNYYGDLKIAGMP
jgi:hypothetical protein